MFDWIKKIFFNVDKDIANKDACSINMLDIDALKKHFNTIKTPINPDGFCENEKLIQEIINNIKPDRKNIFILDDVYDIVEILSEELTKKLETQGLSNEFNIIGMHTPQVGFDMLSILINHTEIKTDYILTDITFGGNEKINGKKIIVDGIDVLIIAKTINENLGYIIFTGNILSETNVKNYAFALKYEKFFNDTILNHAIIKDSVIDFNKNLNDVLFDKLMQV